MSAAARAVELRSLRKSYIRGSERSGRKLALDSVDLDIEAGEIFGIVGESGSGKTTLANILLKAIDPDSGFARVLGTDLASLGSGSRLRAYRRKVQPIRQGCDDALDPRMRIRDSLREIFLVRGKEAYRSIDEAALLRMLSVVGLHGEHLDRYPSELSGGQLQRIIVARVIALEPELIVADEPSSSLDVSVQAQVMRLLLDLQRSRGFTLILISHDIRLVLAIADRVAVMKEGQIVECATARAIDEMPNHEYTSRLMEAARGGML
jgi:ABC-type glutathione transport system ATPase component